LNEERKKEIIKETIMLMSKYHDYLKFCCLNEAEIKAMILFYDKVA